MNPRSIWYKPLSLLLSAVMLLNPLVTVAGQLAVDVSAGGNTRIKEAANGVPVVDIATPNQAGLSHNTFTEYNVDSRGLILNNSTDKLQATELGGYIPGNAHLKGRPARVIFNEVTGSNRSKLEGYTEVAGSPAQVIVANPHGIACDGCGFLHTPKVTLTTGTADFQDGRLAGYTVDGGDILIDGAGVDARDVDAFELIARSARINAGLHAGQLRIVAGRNTVDADTLQATARADDGSTAPLLAIDSTALGGMYAGAIRLVGTEDGVGVRLAGDMATSSGDIQIDANGPLSLVRSASGRDFTLTAPGIALRDAVYAAGHVSLQSREAATGVITLDADKTLTSGADATLSAAQIHNQGQILAGIDPQGHSNPAASLRLNGDTLVNHGKLVSQGRLQASIQQTLHNPGTMQSVDDGQIRARQLHNTGDILSHQNLHLQGGDLVNQGLLASGADMKLLGTTLRNQGGDIFSLGHLWIAQTEPTGTAPPLAMDILENRSGQIESSGDLRLQVHTLVNRKERFAQSRRLTDGKIDVICYDCRGNHHNVDYLATETFVTEITADSAAARIHAGGSLTLQSGQLKNHHSSLSAGHAMTIRTEHLENLGAVSGTIQREQRFHTGRITDGTDKRFRRSVIAPYNAAAAPKELPSSLHQWRQVSDMETRLASGLSAAAILQAGGLLSVEARHSLHNESQLLDNRPVSGQPLVVPLDSPLTAATRRKAINPFDLAGGTGGLFQRSTGQRYLIETRPAFARLHTFVSSDYLLRHIGYRTDEPLRRLGDGLYEQRLIQQALALHTGKRFLEGFTDDAAQFRHLMDNAIESQKALALSPGIALSAGQVAALTHDIVWLETQTIENENVLVPVLYLAQGIERPAPGGARLQGQDVTLSAGQSLHNSGTVRATHSLHASAENLANQGGLIQSTDRLDLIAQNNLHNQQGGMIQGDTVNLYAANDLNNERSLHTQHNSGTGFSQTNSRMGNASRIEAGHSLELLAGNDLNIRAQQTIQHSTRQDRRHHWEQRQITQHGSHVQIGGNLTAQAGQTLQIEASQVKAGGNLSLQSAGDLLISAAANEQQQSTRYRSSRKTIHAENTQIETRGARLEAGQDLHLQAGNHLILHASTLKAGQHASLHAGDQIALLAAQNQQSRLHEKSRKGTLGAKSERRDEQTDIQHIGTEITTGGDLVLQSAGDQRYQNARLESEGHLTLDSGGAIHFQASKDLHQQSHTKSKNSALWQSAQGKGRTDETLKQSALLAKGDLILKAVDGLNIDLKQIDPHSVRRTIEAMVQADPDLAWLQQAEQRGDVDWRQVKEIHDRFHYKQQGMSGAAALVVAIVVTCLTWGAGATLVGTVGVTNATATAAANAAVSAAASNAATSTINHQGNLGATFKDITSSDALKGYLAAAMTADLIQGAGGALPDAITGSANTSLDSWQHLGQFAKTELFNQATAAVVNKAILNQDTGIGSLLQATLANSFAAAGFKLVGDLGMQYGLKDGSLGKTAMHALMGGLAAEASGGDFKTGALAAGANELLIDHLATHYQDLPKDEKNRLLETSSKIIGVLATTAQGNIDPGNLKTAAWTAENGTKYNYISHRDLKELQNQIQKCQKTGEGCQQLSEELKKRDSSNRETAYNCDKTRNCYEFRNDIDEGSQAIIDFIEKTNGIGAAADILFPYINSANAHSHEWAEVGIRHLDYLASDALEGSLGETGKFLDQTGFNPLGINTPGALAAAHAIEANRAAARGIKGGEASLTTVKIENKAVSSVKDKEPSPVEKEISVNKTPAAYDSLDNKPKLTIRDHYKHHKNMTNDLKKQLETQGYRISDREISFSSYCNIGRCRPDIVYETPDGKWGIIEIKTGNADLSIRQSEIFPQISSGDAIPVGRIAKQFGFRAGIPLKDQGYPNGIPIEIINFPGAGQ